MVLYSDRMADHDVAEGGDSDLVHKDNAIMLMILLILTGTRRFQAMIMWSRMVLKRHKAGELVIVKMSMVGQVKNRARKKFYFVFKTT